VFSLISVLAAVTAPVAFVVVIVLPPCCRVLLLFLFFTRRQLACGRSDSALPCPVAIFRSVILGSSPWPVCRHRRRRRGRGRGRRRRRRLQQICSSSSDLAAPHVR